MTAARAAERNAKETRQEGDKGAKERERILGTVEYIRTRSYRGVQAVTCVRPGPNWRPAVRGLLGIYSDPWTTLREGRSRSDKWPGHGRYFVLLPFPSQLFRRPVLFFPSLFPGRRRPRERVQLVQRRSPVCVRLL